MSSQECLKRHLEDVYDNGDLSSWSWPAIEPTESDIKVLMSILLVISVVFFFNHFVYTVGNEKYLQSKGGPIGARLTMCISRLFMQEWWDKFCTYIENAGLEIYLRAIYVDDGRLILEILKPGHTFDLETGKFIQLDPEICTHVDGSSNRCNECIKSDIKRTEIEIAKCMNYVMTDLTFTTETELDFEKKRLPTLGFEIWSELEGVRHSYFEKPMRSQLLTHKKSSQSEQSKYDILVNELNRRFEVQDEKIGLDEKIEIIDHFVQHCITLDTRHPK